jgi:hypothetical protein
MSRHVMSCRDMSSCARCVTHNIHVLNLPANTTRLLQVADISVFGPFKTLMASARALHQHTHSKPIAPQHVAALTRVPWEKASSRANIIAGFEKAGIYPYDPTKIPRSVYKQGSAYRGADGTPSRFHAPPLPQHVPLSVDTSSSSALSTLASVAALPTVESILSPPPRAPTPPPSTRAPATVNTTYAVMMTEDTVRNTLREKQEKKEREEREKEERKRKREEKQQQAAAQPAPTPKKKKTTTLRLVPRLSNKENIPPTRHNSNTDPYDFSTN